MKYISTLIENEKITYHKANEYAIEVGEMFVDAYNKNISAEVLSDGKMYYNIAQRILEPTMGNNHELISTAAAQIQTNLNKQAGIGIKGIKAPLNKDRISGKVKKSLTNRTEEEIISELGGGDLTKGSCSSLALAYAGNKSGYIVLDFRGGASTSIFAKRSTILEIAQLPGIKSTILTDYNDFTAVNKLLKTVEEGKEYYLCAGRHAAIIKNSGKGFEYLELQSCSDNGFKSFSETTLKHRFGCPKRHTRKGKKMQVNHILIDVESLHGNEEFEKILGFINTSETSQMKGAAGSVK